MGILLWSIVVLSILCIGLLSGIILQREKIPGRLKTTIIDTFLNLIGYKRFNYAANVDPTLIDAFGEPTEIFDPQTETYIGSTKPEKSNMDVSEFISYRYYWHYKEISNFLTSDAVKKEALEFYNEFWSINDDSIESYLDAIESKRDFYKDSIGLKDLSINGNIIDQIIVSENDSIIVEKVTLESRIKSITVPLYILRPKGIKIKGVVIAIHGVASTPEKVVGLEPRDYTRQFGLELAKDGYVVYAPFIINIQNKVPNISGLGMLYTGNTNWSIDLQKLLSVVDNIKSIPELSTIPLITYGISAGGTYAMLLPSIDKRVDIVISSGALTRTPNEDLFDIDKETENQQYAMVNNRSQNVLYKYSDYARLVFPRPLIIEKDALDIGIDSPQLYSEIKEIYSRHNMNKHLKFIWFKGFHETISDLVIPQLNNFVNLRYA